MATRAKNTSSRTRTSSARKKKPATIDLEAKEVLSADAKAKAETATASSSDEKPKASPATGEKDNAKPAQSSGFGRNAKTGTASSKPAEKPAEKKPSNGNRTGSGVGSMVVSALGGAVIAIAGLGLIGQFNNASQLPLIGSIYSSGNAGPSADVIQQINAQESRIAALENPGAQDERLQQLEKQISKLQSDNPDNGGSVDDGRLSALGNQITALETKVQALTQNQSSGGEAGTGQPSEFSDAITRLANLESQVANLSGQEAPDLSSINQELASLSDRLLELQTSSTANTDALKEITEQSDRLDTQVQSVKASEKVARSVAANALGNALFNGDALSIPISSIEALTGPSKETKRLSELSSAGIPSLEELSKGFDAFSKEVESREIKPEGDGVLDRLWANARSLVSVRSSGPQEGGEVAAIFSRIRHYVTDNELVSASDEWDALPTDIQSEGNQWIAGLRSRIEAFNLYEKISGQLTAQSE